MIPPDLGPVAPPFCYSFGVPESECLSFAGLRRVGLGDVSTLWFCPSSVSGGCELKINLNRHIVSTRRKTRDDGPEPWIKRNAEVMGELWVSSGLAILARNVDT